MLAANSPEQAVRPDYVRAVGLEFCEIRFSAERGLVEKLERIKDICAAAIGSSNPTYAELNAFMADLTLKRVDPLRRKTRRRPTASTSNPPPAPEVAATWPGPSSSRPADARSGNALAKLAYRVGLRHDVQH